MRLWNLRTHAEVDRPMRRWTRSRVRGGVQSRRPRNRSGRRRQSDPAVERSDRAPARHPGRSRRKTRSSVCQFSPKGRELASGGADDTIHLWRIGPHSYTQAATLTGNTDFVRSVAFQPRRADARLRWHRQHRATMGCRHRDRVGRAAQWPHTVSGECRLLTRRAATGLRQQGQHCARLGRGDGSTVVCATSPGQSAASSARD